MGSIGRAIGGAFKKVGGALKGVGKGLLKVGKFALKYVAPIALACVGLPFVGPLLGSLGGALGLSGGGVMGSVGSVLGGSGGMFSGGGGFASVLGGGGGAWGNVAHLGVDVLSSRMGQDFGHHNQQLIPGGFSPPGWNAGAHAHLAGGQGFHLL